MSRRIADSVRIEFEKAKALLEPFLCPHCGASLTQKAYSHELVTHQGREMELEHEVLTYECGRWIVDDKVRIECKVTFPDTSFLARKATLHKKKLPMAGELQTLDRVRSWGQTPWSHIGKSDEKLYTI